MAERFLLIMAGVLLGLFFEMAGTVFFGSNEILLETNLEPWRIALFSFVLCALIFACGLAVAKGFGK